MNKTTAISLSKTIKQNLPDQAFIFSQADLEKLKTLSSIALAIIATAGIVAAAVIAPNIFIAAKSVSKFRKLFRKQNRPAKNIINTFYYLKKHGLIRLTKQGSDFLVEITEKGKKKLQKMNFEKLRIPKPENWDNSWWIVLADIPSKDFRHQADYLRQKVKDMGFYLLQRTVWVYPFDPRAEVSFVAAYYGVERFITIIKTAWIDQQDEAVLKQHFKLK
jgi:predicted transcriptional regulator